MYAILKKTGMGAALVSVLCTSSPAFSQVAPGARPAAPEQASTYQYPQQQAGPRYVLRHNDLDEHNRPRPMTVEDAIKQYGPEATQLLIRDDQNFCGYLTSLRQADERVKAAEEELRQAEIQLSMAENEQQRKVAERRRDRARLNLLDILLGLGSIALAIPTGGGSIGAYAGMVALNQGQSQVRRVQSDRDAKVWYDQMQLYGQRLKLYDGRLELYDLRMKIYNFRGSFWDMTMGKFCKQHVEPYAQSSAQVSYQQGPSAIIPPGYQPAWKQQQQPDW